MRRVERLVRPGNGDPTYDPVEEGVSDIIHGCDSGLGEAVALGEKGSQMNWGDYGGQALMRGLRRRVTRGTTCEGIYPSLVVRND